MSSENLVEKSTSALALAEGDDALARICAKFLPPLVKAFSSSEYERSKVREQKTELEIGIVVGYWDELEELEQGEAYAL